MDFAGGLLFFVDYHCPGVSINRNCLAVLNPLRSVADTQHRRDTILTSHYRTVGENAADIGH
ncbi:MAG: hypothetical protein CM15mP84_01810 [Cellvibrionales bacterium]|nr:MAG: hypothetical protein CM15mP84_01810 [Cellvibrionales bacterium]